MINLNEQTQDFIEKLKTDENVLGVILFGSWARGNNREGSDVDLVIILKDGYKRAVEQNGSQVFEIIYTTADSALSYWKSHLDDAAGLWEVAQILFDRDGTTAKLQRSIKEVLSKGKSNIDKHQRQQFQFDAEDQIKYAEFINNSDNTTALLILNNKVFDLSAKFFDLRNMWTPAPKQRMLKIKELNPDLFHLYQDFYNEQNFNRKIETARKIINLVFK